MSGTGDQKIPTQQQQEYYPPPPPGPPPGHANPLGSNPHYAPQQQSVPQQQQSVPQHPNENPLPDYNHPSQQQQQQQHYSYQPDASELYGTDDPKPTQHQAAAAAAAGQPAAKPSWSSRFAGLGTKVATPFNALANKMGSEAFLPGTMDKECEKAARILRGFCKDGIYSDSSSSSSSSSAPPQQQQQQQQTSVSATDFKPPPSTQSPTEAQAPPPPAADPKKKSRVLLTIPSKVIARAQGLAIFTTVRAGFHVSGASGSGVLVARLPDGTWSPPSGIQVHSVGAGFVVGLDIYDCVVVINTREALEAFTRTRMSLGSDLAVTAGPWGAGGAVDFGVPQGEKGKGREGKPAAAAAAAADAGQTEVTTDHVHPTSTTGPTAAPLSTAPLSTPPTGTSKDRKPSPFREAIKKPVYSYVKSRGFYAGVQVDGTVITERKEANAVFYGDRTVTVDRILRGDVRPQAGENLWPAAARGLMEVLAGAEGWRGQGQGQGQSAAANHGVAYGGAAGVAGVTEGVRHLDVNAAAAGPSVQQSYEQSAKAAEAAAEARASEPLPAGPPSYYQPETHRGHGEELPPAYVDDGVPRPGVGDSKSATGH